MMDVNHGWMDGWMDGWMMTPGNTSARDPFIVRYRCPRRSPRRELPMRTPPLLGPFTGRVWYCTLVKVYHELYPPSVPMQIMTIKRKYFAPPGHP